MLRGNRRKNETTFRIRGLEIRPKRAIKYLGVWLDDQGTYGRHIMEARKKADGRAAALGRILPNIGGPRSQNRRVLNEVVHSTLLYAAPVWYKAMDIQRYKGMLQSCQRTTLLRVASAYRTVSTAAIQVVTGVPPIHLLADERRRMHERGQEDRKRVRKEEREETLAAWQREWEENQETGQWTKRLIPDVRKWTKTEFRQINYYMTQALTGHGSFRTYTHRIGKAGNEECVRHT